MTGTMTWVGLDVHARSITVSTKAGEVQGERLGGWHSAWCVSCYGRRGIVGVE